MRATCHSLYANIDVIIFFLEKKNSNNNSKRFEFFWALALEKTQVGHDLPSLLSRILCSSRSYVQIFSAYINIQHNSPALDTYSCRVWTSGFFLLSRSELKTTWTDPEFRNNFLARYSSRPAAILWYLLLGKNIWCFNLDAMTNAIWNIDFTVQEFHISSKININFFW